MLVGIGGVDGIQVDGTILAGWDSFSTSPWTQRLLFLFVRVADECQMATIRCPGWNVDRSLSTVDVGDYLRLAAFDGHHPQIDPLVEGVIFGGNVRRK